VFALTLPKMERAKPKKIAVRAGGPAGLTAVK
jgi:hypothetical protein